MIDSETRKLLEAHGLTAYAIERQSGHVTEQAIVALLTEVQEEAESRLDAFLRGWLCQGTRGLPPRARRGQRRALARDTRERQRQRSKRLDEPGKGLARILTRLDDYQGVIRDARTEARYEALKEAAGIHIPPPPAVPGFVLCRDDYNSGHQGGQVELRQALRALTAQEE
jgi:hypothetical protein